MVVRDSTIDGVLEKGFKNVVGSGFKSFDVTSYNLGLVEKLEGTDDGERVTVGALIDTKVESVDASLDVWWDDSAEEWCAEEV